MNYRVLYFFYGRETAVLVHALTKEDRLPIQDVRRGLDRKTMFESIPERHMRNEECGDGQDA